ncbi:MAG: antibiotic biosynthesis monooxygenase [Thermoplasmata archaeon]|nr:antibiotic biosynthesis monooxygenase [Thermoplasmata archaeon]
MGVMVISVYRPKPGKDAALLEALKTHLPILQGEGLATDRPSQLMRAEDGTMIEVFEWVSQEAIDSAHENDTVKAMWADFEAACEYGNLASLPEAQGPFASFEPVNL